MKDLKIQRPEHVWVADITYIRLQKEFVYLAVLMDVFTRSIRGWHLSRNLDSGLTLAALERALVAGTPDIHHSDQGVQYAATIYSERLQNLGVQLSMAAIGEPRENGFAERLVRTIKTEQSKTSYRRRRSRDGNTSEGVPVGLARIGPLVPGVSRSFRRIRTMSDRSAPNPPRA